jgi:hypothetical protein
VIIPLGHDSGGIGHAKTIVGNLVFDSTQTIALEFGKKALDWCRCANDHGFQGIFFLPIMSPKKQLKQVNPLMHHRQ